MNDRTVSAEIAAAAARLIVEEGMEYGPAKRRAVRELEKRGVAARDLPSNDALEDEVRAYLELFCADTQPGELAALRKVARTWMERLVEFRPHLSGAVWRGTATRRNDIHLQLYCDDPKSCEIALIDRGIDFHVGTAPGPRGEPVDVLSLTSMSAELGERVMVHLSILDHDDLRGALRPDGQGRTERGNLAALQQLMSESES